MRKDLGGPETPQSLVGNSAVENKEQKKASECKEVSSLIMEGTKTPTQQQLEVMHDEEVTDAHGKLLDKELMPSTKRICPAKRNADVLLTDNSATQEVKNSHLTGSPTPPLDRLARQDDGNIPMFHKLAESIMVLGVEDSTETFEGKVEELRYFEENGFRVQELYYWLHELLKIKCDYVINHEENCKKMVQGLEPSLAQKYLLLLQKNCKAQAGVKMELVQRRWKRERILKERERVEAELARLEDASRRIKKARADSEREFASIQAEMHQKLMS